MMLAVNFNSIKLNDNRQNVLFKNTFNQNKGISFKGQFATYEKELQTNRAQRLIEQYYTHPRIQISGYPIRYFDGDSFLKGKMIELIKSKDKDDNKLAQDVLNELRIYPTFENETFRFIKDKNNPKEPFEAFKDFYFYEFKEPSCRDKKTTYEDDAKKEIEDRLSTLKQNKIKEDKKEAVRAQLRPFVKKLADSLNGKEKILPNCIMLQGDDDETVFYTASWLQDVCKKEDFKYLQTRYQSLDKTQDELIALLDEAQEQYEKTGKRSIVFVPNLADLINVQKNSPENIAEMKLIMQGADEDYHSTIVFWLNPSDIKNLDEGALQMNRVGLRVNV